MAALGLASAVLLALFLLYPFRVPFALELCLGSGEPGLVLQLGPARREIPLPSWPSVQKAGVSEKRLPLGLIRHLGLVLLSAITLADLEWETRVGLGSAGSTALGAGLVYQLKTLVLAALRTQVRVRGAPDIGVGPDYSGWRLVSRFSCIALFRAGDIITALALYVLRQAWRKGVAHRWPRRRTQLRVS